MKVIDGAKLREMIVGGAKNLENNKAMVDSLNVFPVPDGDTGTNMSLTMASAVREVENVASNDIDDIMNAYARGALKGARGNSGVILSQIIKGLSKVIVDAKALNTKVFAKAMNSATEIAYNAVTKPKEGTILTVIRYMSESSNLLATRYASFIEFFDALIKKGEEILAKTPDMLPVLKKAGVVDAGGRGLLCVFYGYLMILKGEEIPDAPEHSGEVGPDHAQENTFSGEIHDLDNIKYAYCTEYFIINIKKQATEEDIEKLRDKLMAIGDCVIVIGDLTLVKVHVHTNQPNKALMYALQLGEIDKIKIENMLEQNRQLMKKKEEEKKPLAMLSICAGDGMKNIFEDLMVDEIIEGGQTMNPSVDDILTAVNKINSDNIIILPNNKNIILAAEQAKELTDKKCFVVPTVNVPQGIAAAIAFDTDVSAEDNVEAMSEALSTVKYGQVTYAVRTTKIDGFALKEGDIIGLNDKHVIAKGKAVTDVAEGVIGKLIDDASEIITLYYGNGVGEEEANELTRHLEEKYPDFEIVAYYGGQPHYYYMISVE